MYYTHCKCIQMFPQCVSSMLPKSKGTRTNSEYSCHDIHPGTINTESTRERLSLTHQDHLFSSILQLFFTLTLSIPFPFNLPIPSSRKAPQLTPKVSSKHGAFRSFGKLLPSHQSRPTEKPVQTDLGACQPRLPRGQGAKGLHLWNISGI